MKTALIIHILLALLINSSVCAFDLSDNESYHRADSLYLVGEHQAAAQQFSAAAREVKGDDRQRCSFLAAKSYYRAGDKQTAYDGFTELTKQRTVPSIVAGSHFYLGNIAFESGRQIRAARHYIDAWGVETNPGRKSIYVRALHPLFAKHLTTTESEPLFASVRDEELRAELLCGLAERYLAEGRYEKLYDIVDAHLMSFGPQPCREKLERLLDESMFLRNNVPRIGLLAPQSGIYAPYGLGIYEAATLAFKEFERRTGRRIEFDTRDTKGNATTAAVVAAQLATRPISAVLGPLLSPSATSVVALTSCYGIPVISPTASEDGLTEIADNFFQITPSISAMAAQISDFAAVDLLLDSVAILFPDDAAGHKARDAFVATASANGIEIFFESSFPPATADFRDILLSLKETILPDTFDTVIFLNEEGDTLETEEVVVDIKALYIPAGDYQLELIIPQVHFYKINTTFLGGESWGEEHVRQIPEIGERDIFFVDNCYNLPDDREYNYFYNQYLAKFGHPPDHVAALAYDAATLLANAIENGGAAPESIMQNLRQAHLAKGVTGEIRLNEQNANEAAHIYLISAGDVSRVR